MDGPAIEADGLVRVFKKTRAVDGIDLVVESGEIYGFLGPNGAGKPTTVHMLSKLLPPTVRTSRVNGYVIVHQGLQMRSSIRVELPDATIEPPLICWVRPRLHAQ